MTTQNQKPALNIAQRLNELFADKLINTPFPIEQISRPWIDCAFNALMFASPNSLGISATELKKLWERRNSCGDVTSLSFFQFATLSNNLEMRTAKDLQLFMDEYCELMEEANGYVRYYNQQIEIMRKQCQEEIAAEEAMKKVASGENGLSSVKGSA